MNLIKDEEEEEIQLPAYHVQSSQPQVVTTMSSQNNQNLENIRQIELDHGSEMADTDDEEQFHGFNDHEISESADMYLGENEDEDEDPVDLSAPFPADMNYCLGMSSSHCYFRIF